MSFQRNDISDRAIGMAFGTAIGDALGIPFENLTPERIAEIQASLNKDESLFVNVAGRNPYVPKDWPTGRWGDATQLSLAIMHAIVKHLDDDASAERLPLIKSIVDEHVREWRNGTDGWGNGTKNAIEKIALGSCTYLNSGGTSTGNGVIMKLTPIAFFFYACNIAVNDELVEQVCRMTHTSPVTMATSFIYLHLCLFILKNNPPSTDIEKRSFLEYMYQLSITYETKYSLIALEDLVSIRIRRYLENITNINNELLLDVSHGGTFFCVDTLSMVIGLIIEKQMTFETLERAIKMGGDTNIVAAMLGALLGATHGQTAIDNRRVQLVYRSAYIRQIGEEFGRALTQYLLDHSTYYPRK